MTAVRQDYILQPDAFCKKHRVNLMIFFSIFDKNDFNTSQFQIASASTIGVLWNIYQERYLHQISNHGSISVSLLFT